MCCPEAVYIIDNLKRFNNDIDADCFEAISSLNMEKQCCRISIVNSDAMNHIVGIFHEFLRTLVSKVEDDSEILSQVANCIGSLCQHPQITESAIDLNDGYPAFSLYKIFGSKLIEGLCSMVYSVHPFRQADGLLALSWLIEVPEALENILNAGLFSRITFLLKNSINMQILRKRVDEATENVRLYSLVCLSKIISSNLFLHSNYSDLLHDLIECLLGMLKSSRTCITMSLSILLNLLHVYNTGLIAKLMLNNKALVAIAKFRVDKDCEGNATPIQECANCILEILQTWFAES